MTAAELEEFYQGIVRTARGRGVTCAITSGMACVHYGVATSTKDCDVLCSPEKAEQFLDVITEATAAGTRPVYRGHLTAPLDHRWLRGGWTSHFEWLTAPALAHLDVFGVAPRGSSPWSAGLRGLFVHPHTVGEMKRTDRQKDWPFATSLGLRMLAEGDLRGWLHIFDHEALVGAFQKVPCPSELVAQRPVLGLLVAGDDRLDIAVRGEIEFWHQLDKLRMAIHRRASRRYVVAAGRVPETDSPDLRVQHVVRVQLAEELLPRAPLLDHGLDKLVAEARENALRFAPPGSLGWLPDARKNFDGLSL